MPRTNHMSLQAPGALRRPGFRSRSYQRPRRLALAHGCVTARTRPTTAGRGRSLARPASRLTTSAMRAARKSGPSASIRRDRHPYPARVHRAVHIMRSTPRFVPGRRTGLRQRETGRDSAASHGRSGCSGAARSASGSRCSAVPGCMSLFRQDGLAGTFPRRRRFTRTSQSFLRLRSAGN